MERPHAPVSSTFDRNELEEGLAADLEVVGELNGEGAFLAKDVDHTRLSFPKEAPEFDPIRLFAEPHRSICQDPIKLAVKPEDSTTTPPKVRVRARREQAMELFRFLDSHKRLKLAPREKVRTSHLCGAFSLIKDETKDRLILDARLPNELEEPPRMGCNIGCCASIVSVGD